MEISQKKINKLLAAQELLTKGDTAVIEKILEFNDTLEDLLETYGTEIENVRQTISDIQSLKSEIENYISTKDTELSDKLTEIPTQLDTLKSMLEGKMSEGELSHKEHAMKMEETVARLTSEISAIKASMPTMPDLSEYDDKLEEIKASIPTIPEQIVSTPEEIRDKLQSIEKEEEKLSISAIKDLRKELDELKQMKSKTVFVGGGSSGGGRISMVYDLSPYLDGLTKTFALPAFWRVTGVTAGSAPIALRPTIDYTTDAGAMTITFTSEIEASTTLATGQTVLVNYSE